MDWELTGRGNGFHFGDDQNVLKLIVGMAA